MSPQYSAVCNGQMCQTYLEVPPWGDGDPGEAVGARHTLLYTLAKPHLRRHHHLPHCNTYTEALEALEILKLETLHERREKLILKYGNQCLKLSQTESQQYHLSKEYLTKKTSKKVQDYSS